MVWLAKAYLLFNLVVICRHLMPTLLHTHDKMHAKNEFQSSYICWHVSEHLLISVQFIYVLPLHVHLIWITYISTAYVTKKLTKL